MNYYLFISFCSYGKWMQPIAVCFFVHSASVLVAFVLGNNFAIRAQSVAIIGSVRSYPGQSLFIQPALCCLYFSIGMLVTWKHNAVE